MTVFELRVGTLTKVTHDATIMLTLCLAYVKQTADFLHTWPSHGSDSTSQVVFASTSTTLTYHHFSQPFFLRWPTVRRLRALPRVLNTVSRASTAPVQAFAVWPHPEVSVASLRSHTFPISRSCSVRTHPKRGWHQASFLTTHMPFASRAS